MSVDPEKIITSLSFVEYIINADLENSEGRVHYIREIDNAFNTLLTDYPQLNSNLKKLAARLINSINSNDVFKNLYDWENIAIELLLMAKLWHNEGIEIKSIEYNLDNGKSIDLFVKHKEYGEILCEFRSIHISFEGSVSETVNRIKKIVNKKIKDKTTGLNLGSLPFPLYFLFVIQVHNTLELPKDLLIAINKIVFNKKVLPIMIARLGRRDHDNKEHFEIVQIKHLIDV